MEKRGQITLFIIIGIVLLLTALLVIYITTTRVVKPISEETAKVPEGAGPVNEYISTCVYETAKEAIEMIGLQGGYLTMPAKIEKTPTSFIPMDSAGVLKIPLWYYEGEDRTPSVKFIENEISRYLYENLDDCLDFSVFGGRAQVIEKADLVPRTRLLDETVLVELKWPVEIRTAGKIIMMDRFVTNIPVRLKKMLDLASKTMQFENKNSYFENLTIDIMAGDKEIPMDGFELSCIARKWRLEDVKQRLQMLLHYNFPLIRVENTNYIPFLESRRNYNKLAKEKERIYADLTKGNEFVLPKHTIPDAYEFFKMTPDVGVAPIDLKAHFVYRPEWGMDLIARPHEGGSLKTSKMKGLSKYLSAFCINQWHFNYDVIYPTAMIIKDDTAFKGEGYMFQFGFPVIINNNEPSRFLYGYKRFEFSAFGEDFCDLIGGDSIEIRAHGIEPGMPFSTELDDVQINYQCIDEYCELGKTTADEGVYRLRTMLPEGCGNPVIIAEKQGYLPAQKQLMGKSLDLEMTRLKKMNFDIVIHGYDSYTNAWREEVRGLNRNEKAIVLVSLVNSSFEQYKMYPDHDLIELVENGAYYDIDIMLTRLDQPLGGYNVQDIRISYDNIKDANTIEFHVFSYIPISEDKTEMMKYLFEGDYGLELRPTFR